MLKQIQIQIQMHFHTDEGPSGRPPYCYPKLDLFLRRGQCTGLKSPLVFLCVLRVPPRPLRGPLTDTDTDTATSYPTIPSVDGIPSSSSTIPLDIEGRREGGTTAKVDCLNLEEWSP